MKRDIAVIAGEIKSLIELKQEGEFWDFKKVWHTDKADLLHDIICMANNLADNDGYIIIGVDEGNDYSVCDITTDANRKTTQNLVDFLRDKEFAGEMRPKVYVQNSTINARTIDVIVIVNDKHTPFYLTKSYQGIFANNIYTRVMDTNTPKNRSADIRYIEYLWKKRFGLNSTPLERVLLLLNEPDNWLLSLDESSVEYNKYAPEYTIESVSANRDGYEFYLFGQTDSSPHWYDINIKYHQTLIVSVGGVGLDGARLFTASPLRDNVCFRRYYGWDEKDISYRYFIEDTMEYVIYKYYLAKAKDNHEAQSANRKYMECVLVFQTESEKVFFEEYVLTHKRSFDDDSTDMHMPYFPNIEGCRMDAFRQDYYNAIILQRLLNEFRQNVSSAIMTQ